MRSRTHAARDMGPTSHPDIGEPHATRRIVVIENLGYMHGSFPVRDYAHVYVATQDFFIPEDDGRMMERHDLGGKTTRQDPHLTLRSVAPQFVR